MGRKKKADDEPVSQAGLPPVKSDHLRRYRDKVELQRPLEPGDYEKIQKAMVAHNRQRRDLISELEGHNAKVKEVRRKISALAGEVESNLLTIESGTMAEERGCLCVKDSFEGTIISMNPESGEIYQTDLLPHYQRDFIFTQTPDDDCHSCKFLVCLKAALGEACESYLDCHDCPGFSCNFVDGGSRCGFGKHEPNCDWDKYPYEYDLSRDCFFCRSHNCEYQVGAVGNCPMGDDGRRPDCHQCSAFTCACSDNCEVESKRSSLAGEDTADEGPEAA